MLPPWTPDLPALDLLLSVAELGSVGKAAAAHRISQPSASARLSRLERQLGVTVLARTSRGSSLTPAGEAVLAWAAGVVEAARSLTDGVESLREVAHARLRVGASLTIAEYCMPPWLLALRRRHPDVEVAATVANSQGVCDRVRSGQVDIGFVESPEVPAGFSTRVIGSDRLVLVVAPDYPLAAHAGRGLAARDLLQLPLLLREPGSGTRDTLLHALAEAFGGGPPEFPHAVELGSTSTIVATARAGGGVAVVSARAVAGDLAAGTLVEVPVHDLDTERPLTALWMGRSPTHLAAAVVATACAAGGERLH
jgi:DNA-binding transcriptional LysR family regulator